METRYRIPKIGDTTVDWCESVNRRRHDELDGQFIQKGCQLGHLGCSLEFTPRHHYLYRTFLVSLKTAKREYDDRSRAYIPGF